MTASAPQPTDMLLVRTWASDGTRYHFPEQAPGIVRHPGTGICLSGGGMRAMSAAVGQLRGLRASGLLSKIGYSSAVSGGARAATPFTYYRAGASNDDQLLGHPVEPAAIDMQRLAQLPEGYLGALGIHDPFRTIVELRLHGTPQPQAWTQATGVLFLAPYGLFEIDRPAYFSWDDATVAEIRQRNPALADAAFYVVRGGAARPYLIIHGSFVGPAAMSPFGKTTLVNIEYTPLYVGSAFGLDVTYTSWNGRERVMTVGNGFIEPFGFGAPAPVAVEPDGMARVAMPRRPFTLADASGTATASYSPSYGNIFGAWSPREPYWPVSRSAGQRASLFNFGDGGNLENYGIISLLLRKVERVIVFINTDTKLDLDYDPDTPPKIGQVDFNLLPLFGFPNPILPHNQVFETSAFAPLIRALQRCKRAGRSLIAATELEVLDNRWWGVVGGWRVHVLWVYNDRVLDWEAQLDRATGIPTAIEAGNQAEPYGPFQHFPNYLSEGQNVSGSIALTPQQINLLADLSCWNITSNAERVRSFLDGELVEHAR